MWSRQDSDKDDTAENPTEVVAGLPPKNKKVLAALDTIFCQFQFQGMNMDLYFKEEKYMLDNMSKHIKQTATIILSYFKSK